MHGEPPEQRALSCESLQPAGRRDDDDPRLRVDDLLPAPQERRSIAVKPWIDVEMRAGAAARPPTLALVAVGRVAGERPHVGESPDEWLAAREERQRRVAEVAAMRVVKLHDIRVTEPRVECYPEGRRIQQVLEIEPVGHSGTGAVGSTPAGVALQQPHLGVCVALLADQHPRAPADLAQAAVDPVGGAGRAANGVRGADMENGTRNEQITYLLGDRRFSLFFGTRGSPTA